MQEYQTFANSMWVFLCAILVLLMQGGFLCLESGLTRSKNSINVALKNAIDLLITIMVFWVIGFALMFGFANSGDWQHNRWFFADFTQASLFESAFFFFQVTFCSTAITIVSGAISERARFGAYIIIAIFVSAFIYPTFGQWVWGGTLTGNDGWLAKTGFIDFAGSTVVHSVGGWVALAAILIIGPRINRFSKNQIKDIPSSNLPFSLLGVLLFIVGWLGFNGGSALAFNNNTGLIIVNTIIAAASAGTVSCVTFVSGIKRPGISELILNGTIAGLVSITAVCHAVTTPQAALIGALGAVVYRGSAWLLYKCRVDDAVGAVPVHLGAGIWGTLAVGFLGDLDILGTGLNRWQQILVQLQGILVCGLFTFSSSYLLLAIYNRYSSLRVSKEEEESGLNVSEHGESTELHDLLVTMDTHRHSGDLSQKVHVEPFTEVGLIARYYNAVIEELDKTMTQKNTIFNDMRDGIITFNEAGMILGLNQAATQMFGYHEQEIKNKPISLLLKSSRLGTKTNHQQLIQEIIHHTDDKTFELAGLKRNGEIFDTELTKGASSYDEGVQFTAVIRDISQRKKLEKVLDKKTQLARVTLESIGEAVLTCDNHYTITYINPCAEHLMGESSQEIIGQRVNDAVHLVTDDGSLLNIAESISSGVYIHEDLIFYQPNGKKSIVVIRFSKMYDKNADDLGIVLVIHDVTDERNLRTRLEHQASHDPLTGILNRRAFETILKRTLYETKYQYTNHVLLYFDIDRFKLVNDTGGHNCGDILLKEVVAIVKSFLEPKDGFARMGGDEFVVLFNRDDFEECYKLSENIRKAIHHYRFQWMEKTFSVSVSMSIMDLNQNTQSHADIMGLADAACDTAKDRGRNRIQICHQEDNAVAEKRDEMQWANRLKKAVDEDRLVLFSQAIVDTFDINQIHHYEILVRMLDDNNDIIPPSEFIPTAERYQMMSLIDLWVVRNTFEWMQQLYMKDQLHVGYAINLSGASIGDQEFINRFMDLVQGYELILSKVCFEITETTAITNQHVATMFIEKVKAFGCSFALDDFGSGVSSFAYLKSIPVDYLKIDGMFIRDIMSNHISLEIVKAVNSIAHFMGLKTIAEYVKDEEILSLLKVIGVDYVQGFYIHKPDRIEHSVHRESIKKKVS